MEEVVYGVDAGEAEARQEDGVDEGCCFGHHALACNSQKKLVIQFGRWISAVGLVVRSGLWAGWLAMAGVVVVVVGGRGGMNERTARTNNFNNGGPEISDIIVAGYINLFVGDVK